MSAHLSQERDTWQQFWRDWGTQWCRKWQRGNSLFIMLVIFYELNIEFMYNNQKAQNIKEGAFFDYFKCFSFSAADTIRKLERNFHEQFNETLDIDSSVLLKRVKSLLSGYEVLILQINDSCEFVEIPQLGVCLLKIFYQLMSIIKFLASGIIAKSPQDKPEKERRPVQRYTTVSPNMKAQSESTKQQERENFRSKELASHMLKELTQQIKTIQKQTKGLFKENQQSLQKIIKRREKLEEIQSSQSEAVLAETVNLLFKRGEHINNFLNLLQNGQNVYQIKETETYSKLKELIDQQNLQRISSAKQKLNQIFKEQIYQYEKRKKGAMQCQQVQVKMESEEQGEGDRLRKSQYRKTHIDQTKKMKMEIRALQEQNSTLKSYIKEKIEEYESIATRLRAEKITLQNKLSNTQNNSGNLKSKGSIEYFKKSQSNFDQYENIDNISEINSHLSLEEDAQKQLQNTSQRQTFLKKSKVNFGKNTKSKVKFQGINKNLQILSRIIQFCTPCSNNSMLEEQPISPVKSPKSNKSQQRFQINSNIKNSQKDEAQVERPVLKSVKRVKSIQRRRSSLQISKTIVSSGVCSRSLKEEEQFGPQRDEKTQKMKNQEPLVVESKECQMNKKQLLEKQTRKSKMLKKETLVEMMQEVQRQEQKNIQEVQVEKKQEKRKKSEQNEKDNQSQMSPQTSIHKKARMPSRFKSPKPIQANSVLGKESNQNMRVIKSSQQQKRNQMYGKRDINFCSGDLIEIFISEENAKNYQILNLSLAIKQKKYISFMGNKTIGKQVRSDKTDKEDIFNEEPKRLSETISYLSSAVFKVLNSIKKDKKQYRKLCNFVRYPHSSIYLAETAEWNSQSEEINLDYVELRKLLSRLLKLHYECNEIVCQHLKYFLKKIGVEHKMIL